jgi:hypothetical protein
VTARLLPFTVDGLIWAASMVVLDASRRRSARDSRIVRAVAFSVRNLRRLVSAPRVFAPYKCGNIPSIRPGNTPGGK